LNNFKYESVSHFQKYSPRKIYLNFKHKINYLSEDDKKLEKQAGYLPKKKERKTLRKIAILKKSLQIADHHTFQLNQNKIKVLVNGPKKDIPYELEYNNSTILLLLKLIIF